MRSRKQYPELAGTAVFTFGEFVGLDDSSEDLIYKVYIEDDGTAVCDGGWNKKNEFVDTGDMVDVDALVNDGDTLKNHARPVLEQMGQVEFWEKTADRDFDLIDNDIYVFDPTEELPITLGRDGCGWVVLCIFI